MSKNDLRLVYEAWQREEVEGVDVLDAVGRYLRGACDSTRSDHTPMVERGGYRFCTSCGETLPPEKTGRRALTKDKTNAG